MPTSGSYGTAITIDGSGFGTKKPSAFLLDTGTNKKYSLKVTAFTDAQVTATVGKAVLGTLQVGVTPKGTKTPFMAAQTFEVLAPDIVWVGLWPGQLCRNRAEVLEMLKAAQAGGIEARPEIVRDEGDRFVVDPHLPIDERHQVFVLDDGVVTEVRAYPDRAAALAAMEPPW